jgi:flagellar hook protein FlgE
MGFQQGLSGLTAAATNLEVIGNNIANANTIGAKASRAEFADLYASAVGGGSSMGIGTRLAAVSQNHTQGSITTTGNNLDLALNGQGYFLLKDTAASTQATGAAASMTLSRNGQFKANSDGFLVNNNGLRLQGYLADATGTISAGGTPSDLKVPDSFIDPNASSAVDITMNLNPSDTSRNTIAFDAKDGKSFNYSTSFVAYDEQGQSTEMGLFFRKSDADVWDVFVTANGEVIGSGAANDPMTPMHRFKFSSADGTRDPVRVDDGGNLITDANGVAEPAVLTVDAADINTPLNTTGNPVGLNYRFAEIAIDLTEATQISGDYMVNAITQDGFAKGVITGYGFDKQGLLSAQYSNGEKRTVGQLAIRTVRNPQGLEPQGGNGWMETRNSGSSADGVPGGEGIGEIVTGALEESNVDLTAELVSLITAQRTYQANAQTIKTQDQVLQSFINMR